MFSEWSDFGECDNSCGAGIQNRTRECLVDEDMCIPTELSGDCVGDTTESECCVGYTSCGQLQESEKNRL